VINAPSGRTAWYRVSYDVVTGPSELEYVGTSVVPSGAYIPTWLFIRGTATFDPNNAQLASYSGGTDICQALGLGVS
jgi:hypothetical protein